ncbi:hypothetical protein RYX36_019493, partial [Vicia faba]
TCIDNEQARNKNDIDTNIKKSLKLKEPLRPNVENTNQLAEDVDTDNEGQMMNEIFTSAFD